MIKESKRTYLPAAGRDWLLPLYDPIVKLLGIDSDRKALVNHSDIQSGYHILDIGCGTGSLVVQIKRKHPNVGVVGLDPDPNALARARRKAERASLSVRFDRGFSDELPYPDKYFDRVFSSFMLHHLEADEKERTISEVRRVLKSGGFFYLLDFGHSESKHSPEGSFLSRWIHARHQLKNNSEDRIFTLMSEAGLVDIKRISHRSTFFVHIVCYRASSP